MYICKHCKNSFEGLSASQKANHSRWCHDNPKRSSYTNDGSRFQTEEAKAKRADSIRKAYADGKYDNVIRKSTLGYRHTEETRELIREKALKSKHRRLVRSMREYVCKDGSTVMLDSSWEEALAIRLDSIGVEWIRPTEPIPYVGSDGRTHNYFPDFYLPKHDLYLDPKNPAAIAAQQSKLDSLKSVMCNLVIIETLQECKNYRIV